MILFLHKKVLCDADVYKTNQIYGSHIAVRCKKLWNKSLVIRQGYSHYENRCKEYGEASSQAFEAKRYEHKYLEQADGVIFTTKELADSAESYKLDKNIHIIPNYVVPETWYPAHKTHKRTSQVVITFFGRLSAEKSGYFDCISKGIKH